MSRPLTAPRPRNRRYVACANCAQVVTLNNLSTHWKRHPEERGPRRFTELPGRVEEDAAPARLPAVVERTAPPRVERLPPIAADDVVIAVVEQLAGADGRLPVAHVAALLTWHASTAAFLRAVSDRL